jgi:glucokinase
MSTETNAATGDALRELALAIDIGGSKMAVGLVSRKGEMLDRDVIRTDLDKNANDLFSSLATIVRRQVERAEERHGGRVVVCGIGSAGPI